MALGVKLTIAVYLMLLFNGIKCHPQCLDFRAPYENKDVQFCTQYTDAGCCTTERDRELKIMYETIIANEALKNSVAIQYTDTCKDFLQEILCQECSPYAAHIYEAEADRQQSSFPGLCPKYCGDFYDKCGKMVPFITKNDRINQSLAQKATFCNAIALADPDYCYPEWVNQKSLSNAVSRQARTEEGCLCLEQFAPEYELRTPISLQSPPDGSGRIFISELVGVVSIFYKNHTRNPEPFMDLTDFVVTTDLKWDERGFVNMAFHPSFADNGKLYVYFSVMGENETSKMRISEYTVNSSNADQVNRTSERVIIETVQPYRNHNGGAMLFGVDGYLYIFTGDGGGRGDPLLAGQNKSMLLGKALRLDVDTGDDKVPYLIPADNPFINDSDARPEVYSYGLRNPWRCGVDSGDPETGDGWGRIFCGDVGQGKFEEIDIMENGGNYGWSGREGFECYYNDTCGKTGPEVLPIHAYDHTVGKSVTGGKVYRGCQNPNLQGDYFFADFAFGKIFRMQEERATDNSNSSWMTKEVVLCGNDTCFNGLTNQYPTNILSFGEDDDGELYILATNYLLPWTSGGQALKLVDPRRRGNPTEKCKKYMSTTSTEAPSTTTGVRTEVDSHGHTIVTCASTTLLMLFATILLRLD